MDSRIANKAALTHSVLYIALQYINKGGLIWINSGLKPGLIEKVDNKHHETYWPQLTWNELDCFVNSKLWKSAFIELALCNRPHKKYRSKHEENQRGRSRQSAPSLLETGDEDDGKQLGNKLTGRNTGNVNTDEMKTIQTKKAFLRNNFSHEPVCIDCFNQVLPKLFVVNVRSNFSPNIIIYFLSFFLSVFVCAIETAIIVCVKTGQPLKSTATLSTIFPQWLFWHVFGGSKPLIEPYFTTII